MGGALKSIGGAIGGVIKQVAPSILKAVAPAATSLLKKLTDGFSMGASFLKKAMSALPLPGPFGSLAQKLLGGGLFEKLKQFAQGGMDKLLQSLGSMVMNRFAPGVGNIALPGMNTIERMAGIMQSPVGMMLNPIAAATAAAGAAAAGAAGAAFGSSSSAATGSSSAPSGASGGADMPPEPLTGKDAEDVGKQNQYNAKLFSYQQRLSNMNKFWEMMSTVQKSHDQTKSAMIQNLR
jgi:hypothetical protein